MFQYNQSNEKKLPSEVRGRFKLGDWCLSVESDQGPVIYGPFLDVDAGISCARKKLGEIMLFDDEFTEL